MAWVYSPHTGGEKIPPELHEELCKEVEKFARSRKWYPKIQLKVRFKNQFCYIDTQEENDERLIPLCRLRYFRGGWSLALFTWSNERYSPCHFSNGKAEGSLKDALKLCEPFIL